MNTRIKLAVAVAAALGSAQALATDPYVAPTNPYLKPDGSWISISGTVVEPTTDAFTLDYGSGVVAVEMDDWDSVGDAIGLLDGDKVTVYGAIDDDLFEVTKIEAGSVYVESLNTYFYANSDDEEGAALTPYVWYTATPIDSGLVTVRGTVTGVDKDDQEFTIDSGASKLTVDAAHVGYNPFVN